jgi:integrase
VLTPESSCVDIGANLGRILGMMVNRATRGRHIVLTGSAVRKIVARAGEVAKLELPVHPHMLRHASGFTVRHTEMAPDRFKAFWKD